MQRKWDATRSMDVSHWTKFDGFLQLQRTWRQHHPGGLPQPAGRVGEGGNRGELGNRASQYTALPSGRLQAPRLGRARDEGARPIGYRAIPYTRDERARPRLAATEENSEDEDEMDTDAEAGTEGFLPAEAETEAMEVDLQPPATHSVEAALYARARGVVLRAGLEASDAEADEQDRANEAGAAALRDELVQEVRKP